MCRSRAPDVKLDPIDADDPEISDYHLLPDTEALADRLRCGLEETDALPQDFQDVRQPPTALPIAVHPQLPGCLSQSFGRPPLVVPHHCLTVGCPPLADLRG